MYAVDFEKLGSVAATESSVVPCCVQHVDTKEVLIIAYVNKEALQKSIETNIATFWSTSRNELWVKGLTSGDYLDLHEIRVNCEQSAPSHRSVHRNVGFTAAKRARVRWLRLAPIPPHAQAAVLRRLLLLLLLQTRCCIWCARPRGGAQMTHHPTHRTS